MKTEWTKGKEVGRGNVKSRDVNSDGGRGEGSEGKVNGRRERERETGGHD